jgi:hypothetical protein
MEAVPSSGRPVDLAPGESETFTLTWEYSSDIAGVGEILDVTDVEARYINQDGEEVIYLFPRSPAAAGGDWPPTYPPPTTVPRSP